MRSRFTIVPVLHPIDSDYPTIICALAKRLEPEAQLDPTDDAIVAAAKLFYQKGANPRHVRAGLSHARLLRGGIDRDAILFAAEDFCESSDRTSVEYADYWAVKCCSSRSLFPWSDAPGSYPFPPHLLGIVDERTGDVQHAELDRRIAELKQVANL
jgi:hypothetical protein